MDTLFKTLAILGALAWLPQIITLIKNIFIKPNLKIIPSNQLEIGFTSFGPIINTNIAIVAENKKALVDNIEIELTHESNEKQIFKWQWFEETLYVVDLPDQSGTLPTRKNQTAIALNITKDELIEKKIGFQQYKFKKKHKTLLQNAIEESLIFENAGKDIKELKATKNYNDLKKLYQDDFNWKVGRYSIKYKVFENSLKNPFVCEVFFKMTSLDINSLKLNIENCASEIERVLIDPDKQYPRWNWTNIIIED